MKWLNGYRMRLMLIGIVAVVALGGGNAKADFTFGEPTNLGVTVNSVDREFGPSISADGLSLYFDSTRPNGYGNKDLWVTTRPTTEDLWGQPVNLGSTVNSSADECTTSISADGLSLYFHSRKLGGFGERDIWVTTRPTVDDPWGEPVNLGPKINTSYMDSGPCITADGLELYFVSTRPGGSGTADLWVATRSTAEDDWGTPVNLGPTVNSPATDNGPSISNDGIALFFFSSRPGGYGESDLWMTMRATIKDPWGTPVNLGPAVNTYAKDSTPSISANGSILYFCSNDRPGGFGDYDLWQAPVIPIVDLNSDGVVDSTDMVIMVDYWGTDNSLCDIGPMPWGDDIVDVQDLIVLAEHLFEEFPPSEP